MQTFENPWSKTWRSESWWGSSTCLTESGACFRRSWRTASTLASSLHCWSFCCRWWSFFPISREISDKWWWDQINESVPRKHTLYYTSLQIHATIKMFTRKKERERERENKGVETWKTDLTLNKGEWGRGGDIYSKTTANHAVTRLAHWRMQKLLYLFYFINKQWDFLKIKNVVNWLVWSMPLKYFAMMGPKAIRNGTRRLVQAQAHRPPPHLIAPALLLSHFALTSDLCPIFLFVLVFLYQKRIHFHFW